MDVITEATIISFDDSPVPPLLDLMRLIGHDKFSLDAFNGRMHHIDDGLHEFTQGLASLKFHQLIYSFVHPINIQCVYFQACEPLKKRPKYFFIDAISQDGSIKTFCPHVRAEGSWFCLDIQCPNCVRCKVSCKLLWHQPHSKSKIKPLCILKRLIFTR
ncbi:hypothetical protein ADUPG1_013381 [Aduncisulcus paluster]|uniref:Transposase n=1 Tax=Aduncisulcus paluster TaxID=2918883 RepID=A0ABQ5K2Q1_9EUKA|nr:hypothetical protein ADUPG1_013381 [Aduncisulcus paluster]